MEGCRDLARAAALTDQPKHLQLAVTERVEGINAVSPEILEVCRAKYDGFFRGHVHISNEAVGLAFSKAVEGCLSGQVLIVD